jgi:hypothetical protein
LRYLLPVGLSRFIKETRMSDKRTTPDPAEGERRRKRPAPTIDLTATEVPAAADQPNVESSEQAEPPQPPPQPEAAHVSEPADGRTGSSQKRGAPWQTLFAGIAGAAIMTGVLVALWLVGLVPSRYAGSTSADPASIAALNDRMAKVEAAAAKVPGNDASVSARFSASDNAMKSLGIALTALNKRNDEVAASVADARTRADAAEKTVTQLHNSVQDLTRNTSAGLSPADVDTVQKRLAALEQAANRPTNDNTARLALSAAALRDAVASGAPFTAELDQAKALSADEKTLAPLAPFAASGVPPAAALAQELRALIPAMLKASGAQAPVSGFLERLQANAGKLVRVRPVDAPASDDASAVLARIELESVHADIAGALADLSKLDGAVRAPAQVWISKAQARQAALAAAHRFAAETARMLGRP